MREKYYIISLVNFILGCLLVYLWFFKTGPIKPPDGSLLWPVLFAIFGGAFSIWSIKYCMNNRKLVEQKLSMISIVLPTLFILFHLYWIILISFNLLTR